ncbi:unnamed protein product [Alopecurus aequalis]
MAGSPYRLRHRRLMDTAPASPSSDPEGHGHSGSSGMPVMVSILVVVIICTLCYCVYCWRWRKRNAVKRTEMARLRPLSNSDLPVMDLAVISAATNNFSKENKLGEGGFGPVYRGVLDGASEIAVKRLSARSRQGAAEFRNEVELIAKLQHRNLVRLLGCCVEKDEKMLVYEYLPNRSLDAFLFGTGKTAHLDWRMRQSIILGIARGLLYLHEDSCLKIVHRDLKASNVLLDNKMNPKISDFGMAKIFEDERVHGAGVRDGGRLLGEVGRVQLRGPSAGDPQRPAQRRNVPPGAPAHPHPTSMAAVERGQGGRVHGRVAGTRLVRERRGVAVLPRRPAVRAGEPRAPADHVQRRAYAHQRPGVAAGAPTAAAVREAEEGGLAVGVLAGD